MSQTLHDLGLAYTKALRASGKTPATVYTYGKDIEVIEAYFGKDLPVTDLTAARVGKFLKSDALLKLPNGRERAKPTVDKLVRVLRLMLVWAKDKGWIEELPLPKTMPMGRSAKDASKDEGEDEKQ